MFDVEKYFDSPAEDDLIEIDLQGDRFRIRRLDGIDMLQLCDMQELDRRIVHILGHCVIGQEKEPIGTENAKRFIRKHQRLAVELTSIIIRISEEINDQEEVLSENTRKIF